MLLLFKRNDLLGLIILVFVAFVLRLAFFVNPPDVAELGNFYTTTFGRYNWLHSFYENVPRFFIFLSTLYWILFSVLFKYVLVNEKLVHRRDFTPAIAFLVMSSALPPFIIFSVAGMAASLLFIAFGVAAGTAYNRPARSRYFLVGFFVGLATCLYWPAGIAFLALFFMLLSIRMFVVQELLALFLGVLFPLYLVYTVHYIFTGQFFDVQNLALSFQLPVGLSYRWATLVFSVALILLTFYGLYISRDKIVENKIQILKKWNGVVLFLIAGMLIGVTASSFPGNPFIFMLIPFSIILSSALINNLKKYNTFTFYFVLIVVLALQWVLRFI